MMMMMMMMMDDGMGVLNSDLQGHRERTDDFPACKQVARVSPLDFRASSLRRPRPSHRRGLRDLRLFHTAPRWPPWHQPHRPQPYRGMFPHYPPLFSLNFAYSFCRVLSSLTLSSWITFISASSRRLVRCSAGCCA